MARWLILNILVWNDSFAFVLLLVICCSFYSFSSTDAVVVASSVNNGHPHWGHIERAI